MKRFHPSPALVISLLALFVALGGTSYAAITALPKNSVGTKQIKNGAVTAKKISPSAHVAPVAYALVSGAGTVSEANGITQSMVHLEKTSAFCFSHLPFTPKGGTVVPEYPGGSNPEPMAFLSIVKSGTALDCSGAGETVEVATESEPGLYAAVPFYIVLYG